MLPYYVPIYLQVAGHYLYTRYSLVSIYPKKLTWPSGENLARILTVARLAPPQHFASWQFTFLSLRRHPRVLLSSELLRRLLIWCQPLADQIGLGLHCFKNLEKSPIWGKPSFWTLVCILLLYPASQKLVFLNLKFRKKPIAHHEFWYKISPSFSPLCTMPNGCLNWLRNQAGFRFSKLVSFLVWLSFWFDHKFLVRQPEMEKFSNKILVCTNTIGFWVLLKFYLHIKKLA